MQGDVIGVYRVSDNEQVAEYQYDAWGNIIYKSGDLADINPFRYRTYYYDNETWFYYLQSRYYDPAIGRWISPEPNVYTGAFDSGAGLLGNNVYAYCANNPVIFKDTSGYAIKRCDTTIEDGSSKLLEPSAVEAVYIARSYAVYKDHWVIRHSSDQLSSWAIGGIIFLNHNNDKLTLETQTEILNHEYGHLLQEQELGTSKYIFTVFIPSAAYNGISTYLNNKDHPLLYDNYYNMPWEYGADMRVGIHRTEHTSWAKDLYSVYKLLME